MAKIFSKRNSNNAINLGITDLGADLAYGGRNSFPYFDRQPRRKIYFIVKLFIKNLMENLLEWLR